MPRCFAPPPFRSFLEQSIDVPSNVGRNGRSRENSSIEIRPGISSCRSNPSERRGTTHRRVTRDRRVFYHESFLIVFLLVFESFLFSRRGFLARVRAPSLRRQLLDRGNGCRGYWTTLGSRYLARQSCSPICPRNRIEAASDFPWPSVMSITVTAIEWNR